MQSQWEFERLGHASLGDRGLSYRRSAVRKSSALLRGMPRERQRQPRKEPEPWPKSRNEQFLASGTAKHSYA
jgi:hypothetical protein